MVRRQSSPAQLLEAHGSEVGRGLLGWELGLLHVSTLEADQRGGELLSMATEKRERGLRERKQRKERGSEKHPKK